MSVRLAVPGLPSGPSEVPVIETYWHISAVSRRFRFDREIFKFERFLCQIYQISRRNLIHLLTPEAPLAHPSQLLRVTHLGGL